MPGREGGVVAKQLHYGLKSVFEVSMLIAAEIQSLNSTWQQGGMSRDTLLHSYRAGEILPPARTNEQEVELIRKQPAPVLVSAAASAAELVTA